MAPIIGFDYTERIDPAALKAAGCSAAFRYLSQPGWPKNLTQPEARELLAAGIAIVLNYETTATFMLGGYNAGATAARSARAQADALGAPKTARIWYSADFNASAAQIPVLLDFARGAASVDGQAEVGIYGGLRVARADDAAGFPTWQTIAWSGGQWDPHDVARQAGEQRYVGGVQVDVNEIEDLAALGAWGGPAPSSTSDPGGSTVGTIPPSISQKWPDLAGEFPPNASYTDESALIWADGGARAAALFALQARDAINALAAKLAAPAVVTLTADQLAAMETTIAADIEAHLTQGSSAADIAAAVMHRLSADTANG